MSELWYPGAIRRDGPAWKVGYSFAGESGPKRGEVKHSAEGYWPGIYSRLDGSDRASWHFTVGYDRVEQHYPLTAHCWHAGDVDDDGAVAANVDFIGIEHLGVAGQPLTPYQLDATSEISLWAMERAGFVRVSRYAGAYPDRPTWLLAEHREVSDVPTACPSWRIPWAELIQRLEEGLAMPTDSQWLNATRIILTWAILSSTRQTPNGTLKAQLKFLLGIS